MILIFFKRHINNLQTPTPISIPSTTTKDVILYLKIDTFLSLNRELEEFESHCECLGIAVGSFNVRILRLNLNICKKRKELIEI